MSRRSMKNLRLVGAAMIAGGIALAPCTVFAQEPGRSRSGKPPAAVPGWDVNGTVLEALRHQAGKREKAAYLGVASSPAPPVLRKHLKLPDGVGLAVDFVEPNSPAADAGIEMYDVAVRLNDQVLINAPQLAVLVRTFNPGDEIVLTVIREMKETPITVKLVEREVRLLDEMGFGMGMGMMDPAMDGMGGMGRGGIAGNDGMMGGFDPAFAAFPKAQAFAPGDLIEITIHDLEGPGLQTIKRTRIDKKGQVSLPHLPEKVKVSGETETSLTEAIIKAYRTHGTLENARVTVTKQASAADEKSKSPEPQAAIRESDMVTVVLKNMEGPGTGTMKQTRIGADGMIRLPGLEEPIVAKGKTPSELEAAISKGYSKAGFEAGFAPPDSRSVSVSVSAPTTQPSEPEF